MNLNEFKPQTRQAYEYLLNYCKENNISSIYELFNKSELVESVFQSDWDWSVKDEMEINKLSEDEARVKTEEWFMSMSNEELFSNRICTANQYELIESKAEELGFEVPAPKLNPYNESNFKIQTNGNGFVVRSDSERFGLNEIVFEGISYRECLNYISERIDNIQPAYYVIKDLASWRWDIRDQYGLEESKIERFESLEAAISKFNEYKAMDYLKQEVINPDTKEPARRLTLGASYNPKGPYEMDLLHTENNKTLLISDIVAEREYGYETFMTNELFIADLKTITENIKIDEYSYYRNQTLEELTKERLDAWNQFCPEEGYTMEDATAWAKSFLRKSPDYLKYHKVNERVPFAEFHPAYLTEPAMSLKRKGR